jgi:hypothetical protein
MPLVSMWQFSSARFARTSPSISATSLASKLLHTSFSVM